MLSRFRSQMSPAAVVISLVALFVAIGGVAGALPGKNGVNSGDVKKNSLKSIDLRNDGVTGVDVKESTLDIPAAALPAGAGSTFGVTVASGGGIKGATLQGITVSPGGTGLYTITFPRSVSGCVPVASDADPGNGVAAVRASVASNNQVFIGTSNDLNTDFNVVVTCPN